MQINAVTKEISCLKTNCFGMRYASVCLMAELVGGGGGGDGGGKGIKGDVRLVECECKRS